MAKKATHDQGIQGDKMTDAQRENLMYLAEFESGTMEGDSILAALAEIDRLRQLTVVVDESSVLDRNAKATINPRITTPAPNDPEEGNL
jgi:hypothetical protein